MSCNPKLDRILAQAEQARARDNGECNGMPPFEPDLQAIEQLKRDRGADASVARNTEDYLTCKVDELTKEVEITRAEFGRLIEERDQAQAESLAMHAAASKTEEECQRLREEVRKGIGFVRAIAEVVFPAYMEADMWVPDDAVLDAVKKLKSENDQIKKLLETERGINVEPSECDPVLKTLALARRYKWGVEIKLKGVK